MLFKRRNKKMCHSGKIAFGALPCAANVILSGIRFGFFLIKIASNRIPDKFCFALLGLVEDKIFRNDTPYYVAAY